jgi:hypothetical protein
MLGDTDVRRRCIPSSRKVRSLGELGVVRRYLYWSDRRVRSIAADNGIDLGRRWRLGFKSPALGVLPQAEVTDDRTVGQRHEIAQRVERAIGQVTVEDFVTPPPAAFAKGRGSVTFAAYTPWLVGRGSTEREAVIVHTRTESSNGCRVEVCLFASIENCADYLSGSDVRPRMWSSSSTPYIEEFIASKGRRRAHLYDDDESIAVEILRTIYNQGMMTGQSIFRRVVSAEWFAEVYHDVELDKLRWNLRPRDDVPESVDRIVIGAPLWVRTTSN